VGEKRAEKVEVLEWGTKSLVNGGTGVPERPIAGEKIGRA